MILNGKKGQVGVSILVAFTVIFSIVLILQVYLITPRNEEVSTALVYLNARSTLYKFCNTANYVSYFGRGTASIISFPEKLRNSVDYNITVYKSTGDIWGYVAVLNFKERDISCQIKAGNLTYLGDVPTFQIDQETLVFKNERGQVLIT